MGFSSVISRIININGIIAVAYTAIAIRSASVVPSDDDISTLPITNKCHCLE